MRKRLKQVIGIFSNSSRRRKRPWVILPSEECSEDSFPWEKTGLLDCGTVWEYLLYWIYFSRASSLIICPFSWISVLCFLIDFSGNKRWPTKARLGVRIMSWVT